MLLPESFIKENASDEEKESGLARVKEIVNGASRGATIVVMVVEDGRLSGAAYGPLGSILRMLTQNAPLLAQELLSDMMADRPVH